MSTNRGIIPDSFAAEILASINPLSLIRTLFLNLQSWDDRLRLMEELLDRLNEMERKFEAQRVEAEHIRAKAERDFSEAEHNLAAVRRVRKLLDEDGSRLPLGSVPARQVSRRPNAYGHGPPPANGYAERVNIAQAVKVAVQETDGEFQQPEITQRIQDKHPNAKVNPAVVVNTLRRMVKRGEGVRLVRQGAGSQPNTYEKVQDEMLEESRMSG